MPNTLVPHPTNGTFYFGAVQEKKVSGIIIPGGPIVLKRGKRGRGGYGVRHIWERHEPHILARGYANEQDVAKFVAEIVCPGSPVFCEFAHMRNTRVTIIRSVIGLAVLEHQDKAETEYYSVVTAYTKGNASGTRIGTVAIHPSRPDPNP